MMLDILLILVLVICFYTDFKVQKIYNKVVFPSLIVSFIVQLIFNGFSGLRTSITGLLVGFSILLIPYLLGGIGPGDVKLLALIGAIKGSIFVLNTAIYMGILGGAIALVIILTHKDSLSFIKGVVIWIASSFHGSGYRPEFSTTVLLAKYPYGVAITIGAAICLFFKEAWII